MTPKHVDKDERRGEIIKAALDVFARYGFENASMSQIADAAGISKGTIYLYFDTKIDLTVAAAAAWVAAIEENVALLSETPREPHARLRQLFAATTGAFIEDPRIVMLFLGITQVALRDRALLESLDVVHKVSAPIRRAVVDILLDGVRQGAFRPWVADDADRIATNLVAFVDGIGLHYVSNPNLFDLSDQIDFHVQSLLQYLCVEHSGTGINHE